jgi:hypothetical protein
VNPSDADEQQQSSQEVAAGAAAVDAPQLQHQQQRSLGAGDIRVVLGCLAQLQYTLEE